MWIAVRPIRRLNELRKGLSTHQTMHYAIHIVLFLDCFMFGLTPSSRLQVVGHLFSVGHCLQGSMANVWLVIFQKEKINGKIVNKLVYLFQIFLSTSIVSTKYVFLLPWNFQPNMCYYRLLWWYGFPTCFNHYHIILPDNTLYYIISCY